MLARGRFQLVSIVSLIRNELKKNYHSRAKVVSKKDCKSSRCKKIIRISQFLENMTNIKLVDFVNLVESAGITKHHKKVVFGKTIVRIVRSPNSPTIVWM